MMNDRTTNNKSTNHKVIAVLLSLLILFVIGTANTLAWQNTNQGAFSPAFDRVEDLFQLVILKHEINLRGEATENPVPGAGFVLFNRDTEEQIILDDVTVFVTDEFGRITLYLPVGNYVLREYRFPVGFGPKIVNGEPVSSWYFTIARNLQTRLLELVVTGQEFEDRKLLVFNQRLGGNLEIEKEVTNADDSDLTEEQRARMFEFVVTFSDEQERRYVIYQGNERYSEAVYTVSSGGSIFLKNGQRAVFEEIPVGVHYRVVEVVPENFQVIGTNAQGVIDYHRTSYVSFRNIYNVLPSEYGSLFIGKIVTGEGANLEKEFRFVVTIGEETYWFYLSHEEVRGFENIPVGTPYSVAEYDYSEEGYWVNITYRAGYITRDGIEIWFVNQFIDPGEPQDGYGDLEIEKTVIPNQNEDINREQLFNFTLELTNLPSGEIEIFVNNERYLIDTDETNYTFQFQLRHGEMFSIEGLPHGTRYDVVEEDVPGFIQEITREQGMIFEDQVAHVHFINRMRPREPVDPVYTSLRVRKELENEDVNFSSETLFSFILNIEGEEYQRFQLRAGEYRVFENLEVGLTYEVLEVNIPEGYLLVSSGASMGTLTPEEIIVSFVNRDILREIPPVTVVLDVQKVIAGDTPEEGKRFEFVIRTVGDAPLPRETSAFIIGEGRVSFGEIAFTHSGIFSYTIHEVIPADTGNYTYDTTVYSVTIQVTEEEGEFVAETTILRVGVPVAEIIFVNYYEAKEPGGTPPIPPIPPEPPTPPIPPTPPTPSEEAPIRDEPPATGDITQMNLWIILMLLSKMTIIMCILAIQSEGAIKTLTVINAGRKYRIKENKEIEREKLIKERREKRKEKLIRERREKEKLIRKSKVAEKEKSDKFDKAISAMRVEELIQVIEEMKEEISALRQEVEELENRPSMMPSSSPSVSKKKKALSVIRNIVFYVTLVAVVLGVAVFGLQEPGAAPRSFAGHSVMTVLTGSMEPTIPRGSLVVLRQVDTNTLEEGDIISYLRANNTTVTHRIIEIIENYQGSGSRGFRLQGDNNATADAEIVKAVNVIGEITYSNVLLGRGILFVQANIILIVIFAVLFIALIVVIKRFFLNNEIEAPKKE